MTWTYTPGTLATSTLMQIRLMIGDTNTSDQQIQDEEINWALTQEGSTYLGAARSAEMIAAHYTREANLSSSGVRSNFGDITKAYEKMAARLRGRARMMVAPYAGGISVSDKATVEADTDRVTPAFFMAMGDNPGLSGPTSDMDEN